jgi:hypothetical protein
MSHRSPSQLAARPDPANPIVWVIAHLLLYLDHTDPLPCFMLLVDCVSNQSVIGCRSISCLCLVGAFLAKHQDYCSFQRSCVIRNQHPLGCMNQCLVEPIIKNIALFLAAVMNPMHTALFCSIDLTPQACILVVWTRPLIHARQKQRGFVGIQKRLPSLSERELRPHQFSLPVIYRPPPFSLQSVMDPSLIKKSRASSRSACPFLYSAFAASIESSFGFDSLASSRGAFTTESLSCLSCSSRLALSATASPSTSAHTPRSRSVLPRQQDQTRKR